MKPEKLDRVVVYVQDLVEEMMEIWQLNGTRPLR